MFTPIIDVHEIKKGKERPKRITLDSMLTMKAAIDAREEYIKKFLSKSNLFTR